jgi:glycosyltransferase involved in cell wall biosynthesis
MNLRSYLIQIRFFLFPENSKRENYYHLMRVFLRCLQIKDFSQLRYMVANKPKPLRQLDEKALYASWIQENEPDSAALAKQSKLSYQFAYKPRISFLIPVYNPQPDVLHDTITSILQQSYPFWELCLADGNSTRPGIPEMLERFRDQDPRIKVTFLDQNAGISGNTNAALELAQGEFIALVDHDDLIAPDMLFEVIQVLNQNPAQDTIYFDEDKISADRKTRSYPWFKPSAWSPDLLLSVNFLMHSVIRKEIVDSIGGFREEYDGAQDWDLAFSLIRITDRITHIPRVLYHWRQLEGSTSRDALAKPWAYEAQKKAIQAHLTQTGFHESTVEITDSLHPRVRWKHPQPKISIIIPTRDKASLLRKCVSSVLEITDYPDFEIIIIDNASQQKDAIEYLNDIEAHPQVKVLDYPHPFNYHAINNFGVRHAAGELLVFLNNDTRVLHADWLQEFAQWLTRPETGVVGAKLLRDNREIQHAGIVMGVEGHGSHIFEGGQENLYGPFGSPGWYRNYQAVTGACLGVRKEVFQSVNGFDEIYEVGYGDIDLCLRIHDQGLRIVYDPFIRLIHHEGATRGLSLPAKDVFRATVQMYNRIKEGDPFYNPNLSINYRLPRVRSRFDNSEDQILDHILQQFDLISPNFIHNSSLIFKHGGPSLPESNPYKPLNKVLIVTHDLSLSGAPINLMNLAGFLANKGFKVTVVSPETGPLTRQYQEFDIKPEIVEGCLADTRLLLPYLSTNRLVIANTILSYRPITAAAALGIPNIWWIQESQFGKEVADSNKIAAEALAFARMVVFSCQKSADLYLPHLIRDNYRSIPTGLDSSFDSESELLEIENYQHGRFNIIQIGSLEPRKGQDTTLKAIQNLPPDIATSIYCVLIGRRFYDPENSRFYNRLKSQSRNLGNISILGELDHQMALTYLAQADLFILSSRDEVFPVTLIEAMANKKAIIASKVGCVEEIIQDGQNGLLFDPGDDRALSDQILKVIENRNLRKLLAENAYSTFLERYTFATFTQRFLDVIGEMNTSPQYVQGGKYKTPVN